MDTEALVAAAVCGDEQAFTALVEKHRHELQVHCYRMVGSLSDAEDLVQETFLRAWRRRETYAGRASFRAWLYKIATNVCFDLLAKAPRQANARPDGAAGEVAWLEPYPDHLLDLAAPETETPDAVAVSRETIELAFLVALQHLPPRQRAVLITRDVLGWPATEVAAALELSVAAANSALQRARATLRTVLPESRADWSAPARPTDTERVVLDRFIAATERGDVAVLGMLLREDAIFTMPPEPGWFRGRDLLMEMWAPLLTGPTAWGEWRCVLTAVNRQPAVANYVRRDGETAFEPVTVDILRVEGAEIAELTTFHSTWFPRLGVPARL